MSIWTPATCTRLRKRAGVLHVNFYELSGGLDAGAISSDLDDMAELLDLLQPLTG